LIDDILQGYQDMMNEITWLSDATKANIKKKIRKMKYCACFEDKSASLPKIDNTNISQISFSELFNRYNEAIVKMAINHVPDNQFDWAWEVMPMSTSNAFYYPTNNSFVILNGVVPGFLGTCVEEFYGMLGFVIGHEITHAFDSSGSRYDENGQYNDLMSGSDRTTFNNKVTKMVNFYKKINLWSNHFVDGNNVNGEATADMGGIKVMLQLAKKIENFDYDKFFRAAAFAWSMQPYSDSAAQTRLSDEHPFAYLRVNVTLAQFDEFIETYNIEPGDGMYIPEEERVKIW
jgi:putative endopeptidase